LKIELHRLLPGQMGVIQEVQGSGLSRRRILDLGMVPGTLVEVMRRSPLGDPVAYQVRGTIIALRQDEASQISVTTC
jgi:ferrous iron transport protein A